MGRFLAIWLTITALCWLVMGVLFAPMLPGGAATVGVVALAATAPLLVLVRGFTRPTYPGRAVRLFVLRPFWYVQLMLPLTGLAGVGGLLVGAAAGAFRGAAWATALWGGRVAVLILLAAAAAIFIAGYLGSRGLVVRRFVARSPRLPAGFEGVRIVQLSDLHIGPHTPRGKLARIAAAVRDAQPDLIVLTGDLVDDYARDVEPFEAGLGRLEAPHGVLAIAGNHDVYAGWAAVREGLERQGIVVLVNDAVRLERNGDAIAVLGTGDPAGHHFTKRGGAAAAPDVRRALDAARAQVDGANGFVLALAHNPQLWPPLQRDGVALTLSGHTHWGQLAIPGRWSLASPFLDHAMGAYVESESVLYVHPGTNYWGLPFRLGTPPEVAVITLRQGAPAFEAEG
jgi:predicted MPP superfamily phosphohydrolase